MRRSARGAWGTSGGACARSARASTQSNRWLTGITRQPPSARRIACVWQEHRRSHEYPSVDAPPARRLLDLALSESTAVWANLIFDGALAECAVGGCGGTPTILA